MNATLRQLVNLHDSDVVLIGGDGAVLLCLPPADVPARLDLTQRRPLVARVAVEHADRSVWTPHTFAMVSAILPEPVAATWFVVPLTVALAAAERDDLLVPLGPTVDHTGTVQGWRGLTTVTCL